MEKKMGINEYWENFLKDTNQNPDEVGFSGEIDFENGIVGEEQLSLVLLGKRTANFSAFDSYSINREPLPVSGEMYIVENNNGEPKCIIELTDVNVIPFNEISWQLAQRDGENENLEEWKEKQRELMEDEAAICGFEFKEDSKIVCEVFKVIYR